MIHFRIGQRPLPCLPAVTTLAAFLFLATAPAALAQGDLRAAGRQMSDDLGEAIVTVRAVIAVKMTYGDSQRPEEEAKNESQGKPSYEGDVARSREFDTVVVEDGVTAEELSSEPVAKARKVNHAPRGALARPITSASLTCQISVTAPAPATTMYTNSDIHALGTCT